MGVRAFGRLAIVGSNGAVELRGDREAALLALLVVNAGSAVDQHQILDELYDGSSASRTALRVAINRLRNRFVSEAGHDPIRTISHGYLLDVEDAEIDVRHFYSLATRAADAHRFADHHAALNTATQAIAIWVGDPYAGLDDSPSVYADRTALTNTRADLEQAAALSALHLGQSQLARSFLEDLLDRHRYREGAWALLAIALARERRQAEALQVLRRLRMILRDDLGILPSPDVQALEAQLLAQDSLDGLGRPFLETFGRIEDAHPAAAARRRIDFDVRPSIDSSGLHLLGRDRELRQLTGLVESCRQQPRLVSVEIVGPAGIGKTALMRSWLDQEQRCGRMVRYGAAGPERAIPFEAVLEAIHEVIPSDEQLAAITRTRVLQGLLVWIERLAADRPLVLALDDAHFFDAATVAFVRHLVTHVADRAVVLAWTRRPGTRPEHLVSSDHRIEVRELDASWIAEITRGAAPDLSAAKVVEIVKAADGVAGFAVELARHDGAVIPVTATALAAQRRGQLDGLARELVDLIAVAGRPLNVGQLVHLCERDHPTVAMAASDAVEARALVDDDGLRFSHDLYRAGTLEAIPLLRRRALHAKIAQHLRRTSGQATRECARHALAAGPAFGQGLRTLVAEAALAAAIGVEPEAALELCDQAPDDRHPRLDDDARLALASGVAHASLGDGRLARHELVRALDLSIETGEAELIAHVVFAHKLFGLPIDDPIELMIGVVIPGLRQLGDDTLLLRAIWSTISFAVGDCALAREMAALAAVTAEDIDTAAASTIDAHASIVASFICGGPASERRDLARAGRGAAEAAHDALFEHLHLGAASAAAMASGDLAGTRRGHDQLERLPATDALVLAQNLIAARAATMLICDDRLDKAEAAIRDVWSAGTERGRPDATLTFAAQLLLLRWAEGRLPELLDQIELPESVESDVPASFRAASAMCHAEAGNAAMARQLLDGLIIDPPSGRPDLVTITLAATTRWRLGSRIDERWETWLEPFADEHAVADMSSAVTFGPVRRTIAVIAASNGDHARARILLERTRTECMSSGHKMFGRLIGCELALLA